jgi:hypothetical protein
MVSWPAGFDLVGARNLTGDQRHTLHYEGGVLGFD